MHLHSHMSPMPLKHHGNITGNGTGKPPAEKSKFAQTCNRLSLFLKEKGKLRDLSLGINPKFDAPGTSEISPVKTPAENVTVDLLKFDAPGTSEISPVITPAENVTVDLLSHMECRGQKSSQAEKSVNVLPQYVNLNSSCELLESSTNKASSSKAVTEPKTAQMTIFYGGQVLVLDDVPADRARDLMLAAQNGAPSDGKSEKRVELASTSGSLVDVSGSPELIHADLQTKGSDLPIARRASLHKFLAKRKDRAAVRAPYQVHNLSPDGSSSGNEHSFDLNL